MDSLWQKESKDPELYVNIFERVSNESFASYWKPTSEAVPNLNRKNNEISTQCRRDGNTKFKNADWMEALNAYNQSLCFAEIGSENVSLAYANRSACFLHLEMYDKCLTDIEMAKQANYPTKLVHKLDERHEECHRLMTANKRRHELSYEADDRLPGMANVLEIRCDKRFGRHVVAKCDIPAGKTVLAERAFIARLLNMCYDSCVVCMKISMNFIACNQCTSALFCNSECANANDIHKIDCAELPPQREGGPLEYYSDTVISIIGIFPHVESLIEFVENAIDYECKAPDSLNDVKSKLRAFLQLSKNDCPTAKKGHERIVEAHRIYKGLLLRKSIQTMFETERKKRFLMHLVLHLNCAMINNGYDADNGFEMSIYIISAYFNHSCAPNVLGINTHHSVRYCQTVRPIKAGQQLFASYVGDLTVAPGQNSIHEIDSDCRQRMLYENYGFRCECERCKPNMRSWQTNSHRMQSNRFFQWFHAKCDSFMNSGVGAQQEKAAMLEKKMVEILNRFGDNHWCNELASMIASYQHLIMNFPNSD
ncbi:SET and MYND domain-containing protein DDB_G0273589-like [Bradysia coprophila]|uniref:SET and MYND domain-containing protein DDB_G0273589-like n=1 Tax=Bradysia coprophila TaxID=38358 RepID=UPI00187DB328|nr:SET and MYND domain-containing protein DDB_G0273589-like [Bradysia coprophila]